MTRLRRVRPALVAVLLAGPFVLAKFAGGYFDEPRLWAGLAACALLALGALTARRPLLASRPGRVALAGLALLTAWTAVSITWAPLSSVSVPDTDRLLLYLAGFAAALTLLDTRAAVRAVEPALVLGALAVVLYGLSERLLPGVFDLQRDQSALGRLSQPLTYWNAMGTMAALGCVVAVRVAGDASRRPGLRAAAAAAAPPLALGLWLSFSRGAEFALLAGLLLVAVLGRSRQQFLAFAVIVPAALVTAFAGQAQDGVRALEGARSVREGGGTTALVVMVVCCAAAALTQWLLARRDRGRPVAFIPLAPVARRLLAGVLALAVVLGVVFTLVLSERQPRLAPTGATAKRLTSIESNRSAYWKVALGSFANHPLRGVGSGGFGVEWLRERRIAAPAQDAHSLYVETAAELGMVGLAALALFLGGLVWAAVRAYARDPVAAVGPAAALAVWLVHAGLDWLWEIPGVTLPVLIAGAALARTADVPAGTPALS